MTEAGYTARDRARMVPEPVKAADVPRSAFERDRARVLHSSALRRLAAKTQVVGVGVDDFPRTRLTHSLECAQVGREIAGALGADADLVDAACLAHDLGHPPFGHNGEAALDEVAAPCGGFEGNAQSLRELSRLEVKVLDDAGRSAGLNLTRATLDATVKYPWPRPPAGGKFGVYAEDTAVFGWLREDSRPQRPSLEAQVMDWADDVAYSAHDLEDGVYAGHVDLARLGDGGVRDELCAMAAATYSDQPPAALRAALDGLLAAPWWVPAAAGERSLGLLVAVKRMTSELIGRFSTAAATATRQAFGDGPLRRHEADLVVPDRIRAECALLKAVTARWVMGRPGAAAGQQHEREMLAELAVALQARVPDVLDPALRPAWDAAADEAARLRVVVDQVARLTDTSARVWHARYVTGQPATVR